MHVIVALVNILFVLMVAMGFHNSDNNCMTCVNRLNMKFSPEHSLSLSRSLSAPTKDVMLNRRQTHNCFAKFNIESANYFARCFRRGDSTWHEFMLGDDEILILP